MSLFESLRFYNVFDILKLETRKGVYLLEEKNREISERLDQMEKVLSELSRRVDALESSKVANSAPTVTKKQKGKVFPRVIAAILVLCLIAGGVYFFLYNRKPSYAKAEIGDIITFGKYEQNNSGADGSEPIEWIVLEKQDESILLLSRYVLYSEQFKNNSYTPSWDDSEVRKTLNGDFFSSAFSAQEQSQICSKEFDYFVLANDKIFLLSEEEVEYYLPTNESRVALPTETCIGSRGKTNSSCSWWTRTIAAHKDVYTFSALVYVNMNGEIQETRAKTTQFGIRPALWLDVSE